MASGQASAWGSACSKERRVAELLDTAARRWVDGGRGYGEGVAAMASAMAWESEGEELGENGGVLGVHGSTWSSSKPATRRGGEAGRRPAAWRTLRPPSGTCLPAWPASSSLARRWAGPAGGPVSRRQVRFPLFFCFYLLCKFVDLLKIPRQLLNFPNCSWPLAGIYTAWNILVWRYLNI